MRKGRRGREGGGGRREGEKVEAQIFALFHCNKSSLVVGQEVEKHSVHASGDRSDVLQAEIRFGCNIKRNVQSKQE